MAEAERLDDIADRRRVIEDFIADNLLTEAFNALQDFARDYAEDMRRPILTARIAYESFLADRRAGRPHARTMVDFQRDILTLCEKTETAAEHPAAGPATATSVAPEHAVVVHCTDISKKYRKGPFRLEPLSLTLRAGEITGIVGRNASGKTTLLRLMMGDILPDTGQISFPAWTAEPASPEKPGKIDWVRLRREIAYVPQFPGEWVNPARQTLNYIGAATGLTAPQIAERIEWNLSRYEMKRFESASWNELSGGYKIRFELVRALISNPRLIVLDEPLAYLDVVARQRFLEDLRSIASSLDRPVPIVVTSQHLSEIEAVADQMILINDGKCLFSGPIGEIESFYPHRMVEIAVRATRQDVEAALAGVPIYAMQKSLEGFILSLDRREDLPRIFARLTAAFGPRFTMFSDITRSSRALLSEEV